MSQLNVERPSGLFSIELVTPAIGPPSAEAGSTVSFERYLKQAARTFQTTADTHRPPPLAASRRDANDRSRDASGPSVTVSSEAADRRTDAGVRENEPAARNAPSSDAQTSTSEADRETSVSHVEQGTDGSDAGREASLSNGEPSSNEKDENNDEESITNAAQAAEVMSVEVSGDSRNYQGPDGDSPPPGEEGLVGEEPQEAVSSLQRREAAAQAGELEDADQSEDTAGTDESASTAKKDVHETRQVWAEENAAGESAQQPEGTTGVEDGSGDGTSDKSAAIGPELTGESDPTEDSAGDARRRDGRQGKNHARAEGMSGDSPVDNPREPEAAQARQNLGVSLPAETAGEPGSDAAASTPRSSLSGVSQVETIASNRPQPGHGPQEPSTAPARETPGLDQVDRARFVGRVARAFEAIGDRSGSLRLRLHPPELGSLRLELTVRNGTMTARLEVETNAARTALLDNLPALRDRLAEQNIKVGRFDVDLTDRSLGGSPQQPGDHPHSQHRPQENGSHFGAEPQAEQTGLSPPGAASQPGQGSQLDVVI